LEIVTSLAFGIMGTSLFCENVNGRMPDKHNH
jgi:hypothetical protein